MPRRKPGWVPALTHRRREERGRVRIPGKGDVYLGPPGCWPADRKQPPREVVQAYDLEVAEWLGRRSLPDAPPGRSLSVNELLERYRQHAEAYYRKNGKPTSELSLLQQAGRQVRLLYGAEPADSLTPARLRAVQRALADRGVCRRTVNAFASRVKRIWGWGVEHGLVASGVWHALLAVRGLPEGRGLAKEYGPVEPVPDEWVERTAARMARHPAAALRLQRLAGMRPLEVCGLKLSLLDRAGKTWRYCPDAEGNKLAHRKVRRVVYLGPKARDVLTPLVREAERDGRDHVFAAGGGVRLTPAHYGALVREASVAAGLPMWSPNRVRHSAATEVRREHGLEGAQAVLGHTEIKTTQVYAERSEALARRIAEEMG